MRDSRSIVDYIESAIDRHPFCACGAGMAPVEHDGALYLECRTHDEEKRGVIARISAVFGHDRRLLMAAEDMAA